jgi:hypothetical protein
MPTWGKTLITEPPERELNALLRRVDWRFLLPTPTPLRVLCHAGTRLTEAVAYIAEEVVTESQGGDCDLVVAEEPDTLRLAELRAALRPGGACYTEWRPRLGGRDRIDRALRTAGFTDISYYRPWPDAGALPVYWIPLGFPGAARYVSARRRLRGGRVRRLIASLRHWAGSLIRGQLSGRLCAVARVEEGSADQEPIAWVRQHWAEWDLGRVPEGLSSLLVTGGPRSVSKVVLLAFAEPSATPILAVKAPRVSAAAEGIRREGLVLAGLKKHGAARPRGTPRVLFTREVGGVPLLGETALSGRPLDSLLTRRTLRAWSHKVSDWLTDLGEGRAVRQSAHWRETVIEPVFSRFLQRFGSAVDPGLLAQTEEILRTIGVLPAVPEQRDFGPWNLLVTSDGELAVLDWESAELEGLPALDLLYYLAYAGFNVDDAHDSRSRVASYRRSLDPGTHTGAIRAECVARYLGVLGVDPAQLKPLQVLLWLIHAESEFRHAKADAGGVPSTSVLGRSFFLALWAEQVRHVSRG